MNRDIQFIEQYINQIIYDIRSAQLDLDALDNEYRGLGELVTQLRTYILEMYNSLDSVSEGNLEQVPSNNNPYAGALKQHTADIRHLIWQSKCIAEGDYNQHIDFMGELGESFNIMINQLKQREELTEKNRKMQEIINEQRLETLQRELNAQLAHFDRIREVNENLRSFKHDIKNHFMTLEILIDNKEYDDAKQYIDNILDITMKTGQVVSSGNVVLDALLSEKEYIAKNKNIDYSVEMKVSGDTHMENFDICVLFGNALDNAIEACDASSTEKKKINIKIVKQGKMITVAIVNTSDKAPQKKKSSNLYTTSKHNKEIHGIGMQNMQAVVKKYNGTLSSSWKDGEFTLKILLEV